MGGGLKMEIDTVSVPCAIMKAILAVKIIIVGTAEQLWMRWKNDRSRKMVLYYRIHAIVLWDNAYNV